MLQISLPGKEFLLWGYILGLIPIPFSLTVLSMDLLGYYLRFLRPAHSICRLISRTVTA